MEEYKRKAISLIGEEMVHLTNLYFYNLNKLNVGDLRKIRHIYLSLSRFLKTHNEDDFEPYLLTSRLDAILQTANKRHRGRYYRKGVKDKIFKRDGYKCLCCGATEDLTIDHIVPIKDDGINDEDNFQTLCNRCNKLKHTQIKDWRLGNG